MPTSTSSRAARFLLFLVVGAAWLGVRAWGNTQAFPAAATTVLESSALRVEITASPNSYAVIEKATGQVLLRQAQTTFTVGTERSASTAPIGKKSATAVDATLTFEGTSETGPRAVDVRGPGRGAGSVVLRKGWPTSIAEAFVDQGERNYGLWEYSYYGTGGALDNRGASNRPLLGLSGSEVGSGDPTGARRSTSPRASTAYT